MQRSSLDPPTADVRLSCSVTIRLRNGLNALRPTLTGGLLTGSTCQQAYDTIRYVVGDFSRGFARAGWFRVMGPLELARSAR